MLAINTQPDQDSMVEPFLKSSGYTFTAVKDGDKIQKAYKVAVNPANVLIDTEGRIVARPVLGNAEQERWLGVWIDLLLRAKSGTS